MTDEVDSHLAQPKLLVYVLHGHTPQGHALMGLGVALVIVLYKPAAMPHVLNVTSRRSPMCRLHVEPMCHFVMVYMVVHG